MFAEIQLDIARLAVFMFPLIQKKTMQLNQMVLLEDILVEIILAKQLLIKLALLKNKLNLILH